MPSLYIPWLTFLLFFGERPIELVVCAVDSGDMESMDLLFEELNVEGPLAGGAANWVAESVITWKVVGLAGR